MLCAKPVLVNDQLVGCGQCMNCRINKRRAWTARILLEGLCAEREGYQVSWCTMTYNDEMLPTMARGAGNPESKATLYPRDLQLLNKRLRKSNSLGPFRFVAVGEYGDKTFRPHYHMLVFGPPPDDVKRELQRQWGSYYGFTMCEGWRSGHIGNDNVWLRRAAYIAHYVTKKMTSLDDTRLNMSREPEFFRMSTKPGIGVSRRLLDLQTTEGGAIQMTETGDVASTVRIAGNVYPLDRTVRDYVRKELGVPLTKRERDGILEGSDGAPLAPTAEDYWRAKKQAERMTKLAGRSRTI